MLNEREKRIQERAERAERGPWEWKEMSPGKPYSTIMIMSEDEYLHRGQAWPSEENADFIAHSRADVPYLLATVGRLRGLLKLARLYMAYDDDGAFEKAIQDVDAELESCEQNV